MIVTPAQARAIQAGRKTQHRRPISAWTPPKPGDSIPVAPGPRQTSVCRIRITLLRPQRLGDLTPHEARHEGHRTPTSYKEEWLAIHDAGWLLAHPDAPPEDRRARFANRWAHTLVTVVEFTLDEDTPRFMARPTSRSGDYVASASAPRVIDGAEAVDEVTQQRITRLARAANDELHADRKRERDEADRSANPRLRAREDRARRLYRGEQP